MGMMQAASAADGAVTVSVEWSDTTHFARRILTHNATGQAATARVRQDGVETVYQIPQGENGFNLPNNRYQMLQDASDGSWGLPAGLEVGLTA